MSKEKLTHPRHLNDHYWTKMTKRQLSERKKRGIAHLFGKTRKEDRTLLKGEEESLVQERQ